MEEKNMSEPQYPYSYHTFLFPFIWRNSNDEILKDQTMDKFKKVLNINDDNNIRWIEKNYKLEKNGMTAEDIQKYSALQYFTEPAKNIIFNTNGKNDVCCFECQPPNNEKGEYIIKKNGITYKLSINNIRLQIYDLGIAILIFELENYDYKSLDDINKINEYGRRISFPFLTNDTHPLCADKITVSFGDSLSCCEDFTETQSDIIKGTIKNPLYYIMKPIKWILDGNSKNNDDYKITFDKEDKKNNEKLFYIKPCVDDRMFVCCLVRNNELSNKLMDYDEEKNEYRYLADCTIKTSEDTISNEIYKLCYIETNLTCQCANMKYDILKQSIYPRWIDYGTVHAVTHHSLVCITSEANDIIESVINPFLTEYVQMAIIALVQRSAILLLSTEASAVAESFSNDKPITKEQISDIEALQAKYVKIQNQLLLSEITVQEQGVEIYELLEEQLYINKNKKELDEQMDNLRDVTNISNARLERKSDEEMEEMEHYSETSMNLVAFFLGVMFIFEPLSMYIKDNSDKYKSNSGIWLFLCSVFAVLCVVIMIIRWKLRKNKIKNNKNKTSAKKIHKPRQ